MIWWIQNHKTLSLFRIIVYFLHIIILLYLGYIMYMCRHGHLWVFIMDILLFYRYISMYIVVMLHQYWFNYTLYKLVGLYGMVEWPAHFLLVVHHGYWLTCCSRINCAGSRSRLESQRYSVHDPWACGYALALTNPITCCLAGRWLLGYS